MAVCGALRYFSLDDHNLQSMTQRKANSFEATNTTAHGQAGLWEGTTRSLQICINYHNSCYWVAYWHWFMSAGFLPKLNQKWLHEGRFSVSCVCLTTNLAHELRYWPVIWSGKTLACRTGKYLALWIPLSMISAVSLHFYVFCFPFQSDPCVLHICIGSFPLAHLFFESVCCTVYNYLESFLLSCYCVHAGHQKTLGNLHFCCDWFCSMA